MPRPTKWRKIEFFPQNTYFIPLGKPKCEIEEMTLKLEELEAMRLKDIEELSQEECADRMGISRPTFQNIIDVARKKVTTAITKGMAINISGGNYTRNLCYYKCRSCGTMYEINYENEELICPNCKSKDVVCMEQTHFCRCGCRKGKGRMNES